MKRAQKTVEECFWSGLLRMDEARVGKRMWQGELLGVGYDCGKTEA